MLLFLFIIGISIGSFLNVLIDRFARDESVIKGRSYCEFCKHTLSWIDLIPVVSFLWLKGRCRYCKRKLSWYYPIIELTTGSLFILTPLFLMNTGVISYELSFEVLAIFIFYLFTVSCLMVVLFADIKYGIIPDKVTYPLCLVAGIFILFSHQNFFISHILSAIGACLFFLGLFALTRGKGMGLGDVKFVFVMGLLLGFPGIVFSLYVAFLTGAILSLILIVLRKKKMRGATIAFGPFLVLGTYIVLLLGNQLTEHVRTFIGL